MMRLRDWREVMRPRDEVLQGTLNLSSFAADLGDAAAGRGDDEYTVPSEFFGMTHMTEGLRKFLAASLRRVSGKGGDAVIQIRTAFGGGKTHSMLALYHMLKAGYPVREVLDLAGVEAVPRARVAVLAFNHKNPVKADYVSGIRTYTLCGNMAAQLGGYEYVRENDIHRVSPGKDDLIRMFDELGPCVVLMDELVAYGRKLKSAEGLPEEGTYGNFLTFIQELTEAVSMSRNSLVAATLPESDTEAGDDAGIEVLHAAEHTFGRVEAVWKPVTADEGFEIVRKRLFKDCADEEARAQTADAFMSMYRSSSNDFPVHTRESSYREKLIRCYPVHPEVFARLYDDWSTLERFQRTRGVLRLIARVVRELWMNWDGCALIMPGSLPLYRADVLEELTRPLPSHDVWNGIAASDIDGEDSASMRADMNNERFSLVSACRRAARTIMLGSAPSSREHAVRGVDSAHVLLGCVQPGENISVFNEAMNAMKGLLSYLYTDASGDRYWFDTMPNLQKTAKDKAERIEDYRVDEEIRARLSRMTKDNGGVFAGVHVWPKDSQDVPDDSRGVRLVVLRPDASEEDALSLLLNHGNNGRGNRNMIVFLGADPSELNSVRKKVRIYLAWKDIEAGAESLNLGTRQLKEVKQSIARCTAEAENSIQSAWRCVMSPYSKSDERADSIYWDKASTPGTDAIIPSVISCLAGHDWLVLPGKGWAPSLLLDLLDSVKQWKEQEAISVNELWNSLCSYCYLQRVAGYGVLERSIAQGVSDEIFGLADGEEEGKYVGLCYGETVYSVSRSSYIVRKDAALHQLNEDKPERTVSPAEPQLPSEHEKRGHQPEGERLKTRFYASIEMDISRLTRDIRDIASNIIESLGNAGDLSVKIEIHMDNPQGIDKDIVDAVSDNCGHFRNIHYSFD